MAKVTEERIRSLPKPVQESLRRSGAVGTTIPRRVLVTQRGRIRTSEESKWLSFRARETYEVDRPGFAWDAALKIAGVTVGRARDSFQDGEGKMQVRLLGLMNIVDAAGPELDQGALLRWLNETMWFPAVWATDVISWESVDSKTAVGSVTAGDLSVSGEFRFSDSGLLVDFYADRYRDIGETGFELRPWSTPIGSHRRFGGLELPASGGGVWHLDEGQFEYIQLEVGKVELTS